MNLLCIDWNHSTAGPHLGANTVCSNQQVVVTLLWAAAASTPVLGLQHDAPGLQVEGLRSRRSGVNATLHAHAGKKTMLRQYTEQYAPQPLLRLIVMHVVSCTHMVSDAPGSWCRTESVWQGTAGVPP